MRTNYILFQIRFRSHFTCEYRLPIGKYRAALRHITCAFGANIDLRKYPLIHRRRDDGPPAPRRSRPLFVTLSACHLSRYRESLPHEACRFSACGGRSVWLGKNRRTTVNLFHKARQSRAGEGRCRCGLLPRRGHPLLGGAGTFSSRQRRATVPDNGKVYPTRAKVDFGYISPFTFHL